MRWLLIACLVVGCSKDDPATTSHPAMPNQMEVGSTVDGRYRIVKKLGDVGDNQVFAVEHSQIEKSFMLMTPRPGAGSDAAAALLGAAKKQAARGVVGKLDVSDFGTTVDGKPYVVISANEPQIAELLAGKLRLGG